MKCSINNKTFKQNIIYVYYVHGVMQKQITLSRYKFLMEDMLGVQSRRF